MAKVITTGNFKGGVGKTTNATMIAYELSKRKIKTLLVDLDPQANATALMFTTMQKIYKKEPPFKETLETALINGDLSKALISVNDSLDLLPSYEDLVGYEGLLSDNFDDDYSKDSYFGRALEPLKDNYEYIICDVPPTLNHYQDSALTASDYTIIILQTQERSFTGAVTYNKHIKDLSKAYKIPLKSLGILPVLQQNGNKTDEEVIADAFKEFGKKNIFNTRIKTMARLKRFDRTGITESRNTYDRKVHHIYNELVDEMIKRINDEEAK